VIGKHFSILYNKEDQEKGIPEDDLIKTLTRGKHVASGFRRKKKDTLFFGKMRFSILNAEGDARFKLVLSDTTHKALYAVSTRRTKEEYHSLFNNSFIGIFRLRTVDNTFTLLNTKESNKVHRLV
jgi:hypothetical protein